MVFNKDSNRIGGGGNGGNDVKDKNYGGNEEGLICRRKDEYLSYGKG
jgi:hypothetical protein